MRDRCTHLRITHDEEAGYTLYVEYQHMAGTQIIGKLDEKALGALSMTVNNAVLLRDAACESGGHVPGRKH